MAHGQLEGINGSLRQIKQNVARYQPAVETIPPLDITNLLSLSSFSFMYFFAFLFPFLFFVVCFLFCFSDFGAVWN